MSRMASLFITKNESVKSPSEHSEEIKEKTIYTILFVDDETNVLSSMKRIFRHENYKILTASSAEMALKLLKTESVQVVISDHRMPGITGADLLKKIKELYPETIRIMLTGHADVGAVMGAVNEGAVYKFITKPWNDDDLRLTVSLALEQFDLIKENTELKEKQEFHTKEITKLSKFANSHRSQIGRLLLKEKIIKEEELKKALAAQVKTGKVLPKILIEMGFVDEKAIINTVQKELGIDRVSPAEFSVSSAIAMLIPKEICAKNMLVPLKKNQGRLIVAMADPTDFMKVDDLKFIAGIPVESVIAGLNEITDKIQEIYGDIEDLEVVMSKLDMTDPTESIEIILDEEDEKFNIEELLVAKDQPPAIRIVNAILSDAMRHNASDIHIEPKTKYLMVRYRMDGLLHDKIHIPISMHPVIISRIKIMAELDIAERRRPQDGRVTVKSSSRMVDMRLSTLPTINGEKIVLRILDRNASIKNIDEIGFSESQIEVVSRFMELPQGCILTTGPTGSGKTSTLYSLMQKNATISRNYTTIEDPVEYYMGMAGQVMIKEKIGLTFPIVLRTLLRQDPDVIMLGEIRDFETAEVAFHAALTGHTVLSTLHTNGTVATITRLRDMGIRPYVISDALTGIIAQRLVRRICDHCKVEDELDNSMLKTLGLDGKKLDFSPQKGKGCERCGFTGYSGRAAIFEIFIVTDEIKKLIHQDATEMELKKTAKYSGMKTLFEDGMTKVRSGLTTCSEVLRVLGPQNLNEIYCPHCSATLRESYHYCPSCSKEIIRHCFSCKSFLESDWEACPACGEKSSSVGM